MLFEKLRARLDRCNVKFEHGYPAEEGGRAELVPLTDARVTRMLLTGAGCLAVSALAIAAIYDHAGAGEALRRVLDPYDPFGMLGDLAVDCCRLLALWASLAVAALRCEQPIDVLMFRCVRAAVIAVLVSGWLVVLAAPALPHAVDAAAACLR